MIRFVGFRGTMADGDPPGSRSGETVGDSSRVSPRRRRR